MARTNQAPKRRRNRRRNASQDGGRPAARAELASAHQSEIQNPKADVAVLLVHGIGNQERGSLLTQMAEPCIGALACLARARGFRVTREAEIVPLGASSADGSPRSILIRLTKGQRERTILFVEAVWSDSFKRPPWWQCLYWAIRSLPAAVLLLAPDQRDARSFADDGAKPSWKTEFRRQLRRAASLDAWLDDDMLTILRTFYRLLIGGLLVGLLVAAMLSSLPLAVLLTLLVVGYLANRRNVLGHVVVAATDSAEMARIRERLSSCLEWAQERSDEVLVVGHSQGGYLSHAMLAEPGAQPQKIAGLIGVGSGLKPIWLLCQLRRGKVLVAAWLSVASVVAGEALVLPLLAGSGPGLTAATRSMFETLGQLVVPLGAVERTTPFDLEEMQELQILSFTSFVDAFGNLGPIHALGFALFLVASFLSRRLWRSAYPGSPPTIPAPAHDGRWVEVSSYHDAVGRMLLPVLPHPAQERPIAVGGNPLGDHIAYFSPSSILPWSIARSVMDATDGRLRSRIETVDHALCAQAARRRLLRSELLIAVIFFSTMPLIASGLSPVAAIAQAGVWLLTVSVALSLLFSWHEARANRRALAAMAHALGDNSDPEVGRLPVERRHRVLPTLLMLFLFLASLAVMLQLIGYPVEGSDAPYPMAYMAMLSFGYVVAIGAGYRPVRWGLVIGVAVCSLGHLGSVPLVPHSDAVPPLLALPGLMALLVAGAVALWVAWLMRPKRIG